MNDPIESDVPKAGHSGHRLLPKKTAVWLCGFLLTWLAVILERSAQDGLPGWIHWLVQMTAVVVAAVVVLAAYRAQPRSTLRQSAAWTLAAVLVWQALIFVTDALLWDSLRAHVARWGTAGLFVAGLSWVVWWVDRTSKRIRQHSPASSVDQPLSNSLPKAVGEVPRRWNPVDTRAWYYGRDKNKNLNQSIATLATYCLAFGLAFLILTNLQGCREIYDLPSGGGQEKTIAQTVKIQKVIRKKYVVNPYSAIIFKERQIDQIDLQINKITEHAYVIGQGAGTGAGFGGGKPRGKVRFIRLEYDGGDWNQDFGVGGDLNMLREYGRRTQHQVAKKTESRRIVRLRNFPMYRSPPLVYITGQRNISTSRQEEKILREYLLDKRGMIFCDNGGSRGFHNQFLALMNRVLPDVRPVPVPLDDRIHTVPYAIPFLPYVAPHGGKDALGWYKEGRWVCYYHPGDIGDAWADGHAGVKPEVYEACYQLGTNVMFYANAEYSKWVQAQEKKM